MHSGQAGQAAASSGLALAIKDEAHSEAARPVPLHAGQAAAASSGMALAIKDEAHSDVKDEEQGSGGDDFQSSPSPDSGDEDYVPSGSKIFYESPGSPSP